MASIVEHIVLFKVRQDAPAEKKLDLVRELNALKSLDGVLHLNAGPALNSSCTDGFTHVLHSRYADKAGLSAYNVHPSHVRVVENFVKPIAEDILAMDWEAHFNTTSLKHNSSGAKRIVACKLKDPSKSEHVSGILDGLTGYIETSAGVNFSPARAKGFGFGWLGMLGNVGEFQDPTKLTSAVEGLVDNVIVMDYANDDADVGEEQAKM